MEQLNLLKIECDIPGMIRINGDFAGQTPAPNLCRYITEQHIYLEFIPICQSSYGYYLPIARMLDFDKEHPNILENDGRVELYLLPENACTVIIKPPLLPTPCIPCCIASFRFSADNSQYVAEIYQDQTINLALYDNNGTTLLACMFSEAPLKSARIFVRRINGKYFLFAEGQLDEKTLLLCADISARSIIFLEQCNSYRILENGVELTVPCGCREFCLRCLRINLHRDDPFSYHIEQLSANPDGQALCIALFEAVRYQDAQNAMQLLSPSLREQLSFADLCEFLGDIQGVYLPLCHESRIATIFKYAPNIYRVRFFRFQISQQKISNLEEQ